MILVCCFIFSPTVKIAYPLCVCVCVWKKCKIIWKKETTKIWIRMRKVSLNELSGWTHEKKSWTKRSRKKTWKPVRITAMRTIDQSMSGIVNDCTDKVRCFKIDAVTSFDLETREMSRKFIHVLNYKKTTRFTFRSQKQSRRKTELWNLAVIKLFTFFSLDDFVNEVSAQFKSRIDNSHINANQITSWIIILEFWRVSFFSKI